MTDDIRVALQVLRKGGVILYPTDTIWGIGCDATNVAAVKRIYEIKQRNDTRNMLVLLDTTALLDRYIREVPPMAWDLAELTDKPLTIIYPGAKNLAENLVADDGTIGIRIVQDDFCRELISQLRKPLVSTSANISGKPWPESFRNIDPVIFQRVDYVVKWRQEDHTKAKPSGVIKLGLHGEIEVIRP
ncbi:MAG: threonylcarbamoyl-AMP synthase [Bacteroidales bacterium]|nr:threonylcarbamoyl-AMP synthase [Bacteroidales bacterium]MBN2761955.1 threonylcarbamoyl-AMP synthase [Bacteroidales bacterium]